MLTAIKLILIYSVIHKNELSLQRFFRFSGFYRASNLIIIDTNSKLMIK